MVQTYQDRVEVQCGWNGIAIGEFGSAQ